MRVKKKLSKILSLALACLTVCGAISMTSCKSSSSAENSDSVGGTGNTPTVQNPISDALNRGPLTNTLHKVNVTPSNRTLVTQAGTVFANTEYKIIADTSNSYTLRAATFISQHLSNASYATFTVETHTPGEELEIDSNSKYIIIGCKDLFTKCGLQMPVEDLGPSGYYIKSHGDSLFLEVKMTNGYQMGAIALLKAIVGYDMIAHDTVVYENKGEILPDIDIIERPDYDYRNYTNWMEASGLYGMGYEVDPIFVAVGENKKRVHNIFEFLPVEKYLDEHEEWYSNNSKHRQLCYTAHGDPEEYEAMQEAMLQVMMESVISQPMQNVITITQEDAPYCCDCEVCSEVLRKDGSIAATIIRYMNDLDEKFQAALDAYAEETKTERRYVQIAFFAYHTSYSPPTTPVSEDPTLKCSPNITVFIAPLDAKYIHSFYHEENRVFADAVKAWSEYTDNIMAWVYETDYHHYMFPYNTYSSMVDTYYFFKQQGANIIYNEGQRLSENVTCFGKLKEYLDSKAQIDVTISYEEYKNKFFKNYYGAAADIMEQYYNELRQWETYLESVQDYGLGGGIYQEIGSDKRFWPKEMLEGWLELMDQAYKAVAYLELENPQEYAKLIKHIKIETLFPRYAICTLHEASYTPTEMLIMRQEFKADGDELGLIQQMEHGYITDVYKQWGLM